MTAKDHEDSYLMFEDLPVKWLWKRSELIRFREMWNEGESIHDIAKEFGTNKRTIGLLIVDQAERRKIKQRRKGLYRN